MCRLLYLIQLDLFFTQLVPPKEISSLDDFNALADSLTKNISD